jgi:Na+-transporting NADH:ubiquinone oxidoreductase subunit A
VVIAMSPPSAAAPSTGSRFAAWSANVASNRPALRELLLESGLWMAFRTRPYSEVPAPDAEPHAVFVTAMDTNPLAPNVDVIVAARADDFNRGLEALVALTDAPVYLCRTKGSRSGEGAKGVRVAEFAGKHPSGTVGFHIHTLAPASRAHVSWHLGAQDVIRLGALLRTGVVDASHVIALGGPLVREPRLLRTVLGANVSQLVQGELLRGERDGHEVPPRVISGSVLTGRTVADNITGFLGRFEQQVCAVPEVKEGDFAAWMLPASRSYSFLPAFFPLWKGKVERAFDTRLHGGRRAMVPIGVYERVLPMDLMATHLLRALAVGDTELSEQLGALELDEEDLALCTFVCPSKYEHGAALRRVLDLIAAER